MLYAIAMGQIKIDVYSILVDQNVSHTIIWSV